MCETCDGKEKDGVGVTRRAVLALAAGAAGTLAAALLSCRDEPKEIPATRAAATTKAAPAPDLGSEVFPDASGKAIAKASDAPVIVLPRSDWTKTGPNLNDIKVMNGVNRLTVHHTAFAITTDAWKPTAGELEDVRDFHTGTKPADRGWADIAYHFVVDRAGRVWQARPLAYQGAHVHLHNEHNLGIVLLGNFDVQSPAAAQLIALEGFIGFVRKLYGIPLNSVYTHGELGQTGCPGKKLEAYMIRARKKWAAAEGVTWMVAKPATAPASGPATKPGPATGPSTSLRPKLL